MNLAIEKAVKLILILVVLVAILYFFFSIVEGGTGLSNETTLRMCCDKYRANECNFGERDQIFCDDKESQTLGSLATSAGYSTEGQLNEFCGRCPE